VTAAVQFIAGDKEGAQKPFAASTGNLCSTYGAVGGFDAGHLVGYLVPGAIGPPLGALAGIAFSGLRENKLNGKVFDLSGNKASHDSAIGGDGGVLHVAKGSAIHDSARS
jgi:hypothetical protein